MADLTLSRLIRTLKNTFGIGRLTIDASTLTAARVIHAPDSDIHLGDVIGAISFHVGATVPAGWMRCEGQLLALADYPLLFAAIGNVYGGNGTTSLALPNFRNAGSGPKRIICVDYHSPQPVLHVTVPAGIVGPVSGIYWAGDLLHFSVQLLELVTVTGGPPKLSITIGTNSYLLSQATATATAWEYEYVVQAADFGEITATIDLNGATLTVAAIPANLDSHYLPGVVLGMQLVGAQTTMTPTAATHVITQIHQLSGASAAMTPTSGVAAITQTQQLAGAGSTMTPTAETNAITLS